MKNIIVKLWRWINYKVYRDASVVITIGHYMANRLYKQFPKDAKFPKVVSPWSDTDKINLFRIKKIFLVKSLILEIRKLYYILEIWGPVMI